MGKNSAIAWRPILFSAPMILALLANRKTVTRRLSPRWDKVRPGDMLWCRETFAKRSDCEDGSEKAKHYLIYRAGYEGDLSDEWHDYGGKWRPSIFLPRWASRISLEVVSVRAEPLWAIDEADAIAEGVEPYHRASEDGEPGCYVPARDRYIELWQAINGAKGSWYDNPTVRRIEFAPGGGGR